MIQAWLRTWRPAFSDIQSDLPILQDVRTFTEECSQQHPWLEAFRARILWGEKDDAVIMWQYKWDRTSGYVTGKTHLDVCKPNAHYTEPLKFVSYGRKRQATSA